jgi:hypothetical protein
VEIRPSVTEGAEDWPTALEAATTGLKLHAKQKIYPGEYFIYLTIHQ